MSEVFVIADLDKNISLLVRSQGKKITHNKGEKAQYTMSDGSEASFDMDIDIHTTHKSSKKAFFIVGLLVLGFISAVVFWFVFLRDPNGKTSQSEPTGSTSTTKDTKQTTPQTSNQQVTQGTDKTTTTTGQVTSTTTGSTAQPAPDTTTTGQVTSTTTGSTAQPAPDTTTTGQVTSTTTGSTTQPAPSTDQTKTSPSDVTLSSSGTTTSYNYFTETAAEDTVNAPATNPVATTPQPKITHGLQTATNGCMVLGPDWLLTFDGNYAILSCRTGSKYRWVIRNDGVMGTTGEANDHQHGGATGLSAAVTLDRGCFEIGSLDWFVVCNSVCFGFVHKKSFRRHVFQSSGTYVSDTQGAQHVVDNPVDNGLRLVNGKLDLGNPNWMLHFDSDSASFVSTVTWSRRVFNRIGETSMDSGGKSTLEFVSSIVGNAAVVDVGSPTWFLYFGNNDPYLMIVKKTHPYVRYVVGEATPVKADAATYWVGELNVDHQSTLANNVVPRVTLDSYCLDVGSPDWYLVFSPDFFGFLHRKNNRRHLFQRSGTYLTDLQGATTLPISVKDSGLRLLNGRLEFGCSRWLMYFDADIAAFISRIGGRRFTFHREGACAVDDQVLKSYVIA